MKILHVITRCDLGGAQTVMGTLVCGLRDRGHSVEVVCGEPGPTSDLLVDAGITVHVIPELRHGLARPSDVAAVRALRRHVDASAPDIVHCHSSKAGLVGRLAARLEHVPSVYTAHGWPFQAGAPTVQRVASYLGEAVGSRLGTVVICVSEAEARLARSSHVAKASRIVVVPNGIEDRLRRSTEPDRAVVVMVARFASPKRQDVLIGALAALTDLDWECRFVGSGPNEDACRTRAADLGLADRIRFCGDQPDAASFFDDATVAVLLSDYEGQPISVIEAMRAGVPVITSDLPGTRELLAGGAGLLVTTSADQVGGALRALLGDPAERRRMAGNARAAFEADHRADAMIAGVEAVYRQVI